MTERIREITVGVDLGGTSIRVGLYDAAMRLICAEAMKTRIAAGPDACMQDISSCIHKLIHGLTDLAGPIVVRGVGIGSPGPINLRTGVLGLLPNFPGWDSFPIRNALSSYTGFDVTLECDANAAAIAEWQLGAGLNEGLESMAMITLGTGVGSGLILGGHVWQGMFGMAGEVGHSTVEPGGLLCGCGSRGCLEMYASADGLRRLARIVAETQDTKSALRALTSREDFTTQQVAEFAIKAGDPGAILSFSRFGHYLGLGIANLINVLDLPMYVIGGGVAAAWPLFAPTMFLTVREYSVVYRLAMPSQLERLEKDKTFIRPAMLGSSAGLLGAALLPHLASSATQQPKNVPIRAFGTAMH
jgi:glucokinase